MPAVQFDDLLAAFDWVSAQPLDNAAYVSRRTGQVHWVSEAMELEEEPPVDVDDASIYVLVPSKRTLGLGRSLAQDFTREHLPNSYGQVAAFFRHRGAYSKFKICSRNGLLDAWYAHEAAEVERAVRAWAAEEGLDIEQSANLIRTRYAERPRGHAWGVSALRRGCLPHECLRWVGSPRSRRES
jgi:hypothetical protein